jgi:hypothetical protein
MDKISRAAPKIAYSVERTAGEGLRAPHVGAEPATRACSSMTTRKK